MRDADDADAVPLQLPDEQADEPRVTGTGENYIHPRLRCIKGTMLGNRPMADWIAQYSTSHQHPVNRLCHTLGIPMIVVAILMGLGGFLVPSLWIPAAVIFVIGWVLQFIGHYFEGERPEFFKDWRFLFVGLRWWLAKISGKA